MRTDKLKKYLYKDIINYLDGDTFFNFFHDMGCRPTAGSMRRQRGRQSVDHLPSRDILHAIFDPEIHKVTWFQRLRRYRTASQMDLPCAGH